VTSDSVMPGEGECEGGTLTDTQVGSEGFS